MSHNTGKAAVIFSKYKRGIIIAFKTQQITESNITEGSCEAAEREKGERKLSQKQERTDIHTRKKKGLRKSESANKAVVDRKSLYAKTAKE